MDAEKAFKKHKVIFFVSSFLLFFYLLLRAIYVPLVYDEAGTFFIYILTGEFIPFQAYWDANNHLLNSFSGICSYNILGSDEWVLRLPNVLFFLFNIVFLYKIHRFFINKNVWLMMALFLLFTHNVFEYSAYCRGYGMALSSLLGVIYFALSYIKTFSKSALTGVCVFSFLSLAANFTLLNPVLIVTLLILLSAVLRKKFNSSLYIFSFMSLVIIGLAVWIGFELKKRGLLYYGNQQGFYKTTLTSLSGLISGNDNFFLPFVFIGITILLLLAGINKLRQLNRTFLLDSPFVFVSILFIGCIAAIIVLNIFLKVNYPEDRTALYLYPLFVLFLFFGIDFLLKERHANIISFALVALMFVHFVSQANLAYSAYWKKERMPESWYDHIATEWKGGEEKVFVSGYRIKTYIWNYYTFRNKIKLNEIYHENFPSAKADFLIIEEENYRKNPEIVKNYNEVFKDGYNNLRLMRNKNENHYNLIFDSLITENKNVNYPYFTLVEHKMQSGSFANLVAEFECDLTCEGVSRIDFVFKAIKNGETKGEAVCRTQWQRKDWIAPDNKIKNRIYLENVSGADSLVLFISGKENHSYRLENIKLRFYSF